MDSKGFGRYQRFENQIKNFDFFVKSDNKTGLTITKELTVWYGD